MRLKLKYKWLFLYAFSMVLFSCGKESSCFKSTGTIVKEVRAISSDILTIKTEDNIDIVITQSTEASLTIEGGENLLPYVSTDVSGNVLSISSDNKCSLFRDYDIPITVYLSIPNLTKIDYTGQGIITSTNTLNFPDFRFETNTGTGSINLQLNSTNVSVIQHTGPADITLSGTTNNLFAFLGETGWQHLNNLVANDVHVNNSGSGDIIVTANSTLLVELSYIGNIDYYGNPTVTVSSHTGSGQLRKK
ncbi:MAG: hypothetical protein COA97_06590 [Flavobacteriales bacterium]|nr:MAG: hypothetical protein COA97_06590 [Flavobacteriales bacterium]